MGLVALLTAAAEAKTKVMFYFDTEDYTCDRSNDAIRDIANILASEGVKGNFNIAGFLGVRLHELGRTDVVAALRRHVIGTQSLFHSRHPNITELADDPDYRRGYRRILAEEARGIGMLEALFGEGRVVFACPPGCSISAQAFEAYYDLGVLVNAGTGNNDLGEGAVKEGTEMVARHGYAVDGLWYFNQLQLPYNNWFSLESMFPGRPQRPVKEVLDHLAASGDYHSLYMHPHMALKTIHWDKPNYDKGNLVEWRQWKPAPDRDPADTAVFYERLKAFIRAMKADDRFEITDVEARLKELKPRRPITRAEIPAIRKALTADFKSIHEPASWCVADAFQATTRLMRGEKEYRPGKVYGFLSRPQGVSAPTVVSAQDLRAAAAKIDLDAFLPPQIAVGGQTIGPADFLFAALEVLETGAEKVRVAPREQLGSFKEIPSLEFTRLNGRWLFTPDFKDEWTSDRLRLQLWTLRIE